MCRCRICKITYCWESKLGKQSKILEVHSTSSSDKAFGTVDMNPYGSEPYQDEPLAIAGQEATLNFEEDKDGIPAETLESRFTKIIPVSDW